MDIHDHNTPVNIVEAIEAEEKSYINSCLRMIELMTMQMEGILVDHPDIVEVSFSLDDGEPDSFPIFFCPTEDGEDVCDRPEIEEIAEQFNNSTHAGARHFISYACEQVIYRESLVKDRTELINQLAKSMPFDGEISNQWAQSFDSFLKKRDLEEVVAKKENASGQVRGKKPGM